MKNLKLAVMTVFFSTLIFSCSNNTSKKSAEAIDDIVVDDIEAIATSTEMPSSYEIIQLLNQSGASYIFDLTNPAENVEKYITYKQKAINLGIFAADLTYTATYQKKDETALYLDNFVQLVGDLEINTLDQKFFESVQANLDNKDSLLIIVKNAQHSTQKFLNESGKNEISLYALTGSWVEGMYLIGATIKFADNKQPLYEMIIKHEKTLVDLIKLMEGFKNEEKFKDIYKSLTEINALFVKIGNDKNDIKTIEQLKDKIIEFRNSLI